MEFLLRKRIVRSQARITLGIVFFTGRKVIRVRSPLPTAARPAVRVLESRKMIGPGVQKTLTNTRQAL